MLVLFINFTEDSVTKVVRNRHLLSRYSLAVISGERNIKPDLRLSGSILPLSVYGINKEAPNFGGFFGFMVVGVFYVLRTVPHHM